MNLSEEFAIVHSLIISNNSLLHAGIFIVGNPLCYPLSVIGTPTWDLPSLTTLHLQHIRLPDDDDSAGIFSKCTDPDKIVRLLQQLRSAKLFILGLGILQRHFQQRKHLSSSMELIPHQACVFTNAKILKFKTKRPVMVYLEVGAHKNVTTSTEINKYETFASGMFPVVSREEMKAMGDMGLAQAFVEHLGMLLKRFKANATSDTNKAHLDEHCKPQVNKQWACELQSNLEEIIALIKQCKFVASETCLMMEKFMSCCKKPEIIAWLQEIGSLFQCIEGSMNQLSPSKRVVMQPNYSRLCEDAAIVTSNILGAMKTIKETQDTNTIIT